MRAPRSRFQPF